MTADSRLQENAFAGDGLRSLFHAPAFFRLHDSGRGRYFEWVVDGVARACVHFTPAGGGAVWRSPARGTYGGYAFDPALRPEDLFAFRSGVEARLAELGARQLELLPAPMAHDPVAYANQLYMLHAAGYVTGQCDLNHSLAVGPVPLAERMSRNNAKRLRKCHREGLVGARLELTSLREVHETLEANRTHHGHQVSMTLEQLEKMALAFPEAMLLFGALDGRQLAASAVCLRVNTRTLYVYAWGDRPGYEAFSPVVSVADVIHRHCQAHGVETLDAGTSTVDRAPNFGLIRFKRGLGFTESLKVRMRRWM